MRMRYKWLTSCVIHSVDVPGKACSSSWVSWWTRRLLCGWGGRDAVASGGAEYGVVVHRYGVDVGYRANNSGVAGTFKDRLAATSVRHDRHLAAFPS